jgi:hypothetical protein
MERVLETIDLILHFADEDLESREACSHATYHTGRIRSRGNRPELGSKLPPCVTQRIWAGQFLVHFLITLVYLRAPSQRASDEIMNVECHANGQETFKYKTNEL